MDNREELIKKAWNEFLEQLIAARECWEELREELASGPSDFRTIEPHVSKLLSVYRRTPFETLLPRFIGYYKAQGGLEAMKAKLEEKPKQVVKKAKKEKGED